MIKIKTNNEVFFFHGANFKPFQKRPNRGFTVMLLLSILLAITGCSQQSLEPESSSKSAIVVAPCGIADCVGQEYNSICEQFQSAGFENVHTEVIEDLKAGETEKFGTVDIVSIKGSSDFNKGQEYRPIDEVVVRYHTYVKCGVKVNVEFVPNWFFSKYDVKLRLDDNSEGNMEHGVDKTFELKMDPGEHTITFESKDSSSTKGEVALMVDCDMEVAYRIYCHSDNIRVETLYVDKLAELEENQVKMNVAASEYKFKNYTEAESALRALGFTNIKYNILYDIVFGWTDNGEVESVSIAGKTDFTRGDVFQANSEIVITYHMPEANDPANITMQRKSDAYCGMNYLEAERLFRNMGFTNIVLDKVTTESTAHTDGEVIFVEIGGWSFDVGDTFKPDKKVYIKYYNIEKLASDECITIENNSDFASILTSEYVDPEKQASFVSTYKGKTVEFDCIVYYMENNPKYKTIYSYVLAPGKDKDSMGAAFFYLKDMSMFDFKWDEETRPEYLTIGSKIRIQAKVTSGDDSLYIYLKPVCTWGR